MSGGSGPVVDASDEITGDQPRQVIRSPEQVALHLPIAGPTSRMLAYSIDYAVILVLEVGLMIGLALWVLASPALLDRFSGPVRQAIEDLPRQQPDQLKIPGGMLVIIAVLVLVQFLIEWGYFLFWEMVTGGRSIGKAWVGLRVVRDQGLPITFYGSLVRNVLRMVDLLPGTYAVGFVAMLVSREGK